MNLVSLRVITDDVARLVAFYERATGTSASWANDDFAELGTPSATLAIGHSRTVGLFGPGAAGAGENRSVIVEFLVDDVDETYRRLGDGMDVVTSPTTMPWGNRSLLVRDPDGSLVNFFQPVTPGAIAKFAHLAR
ncbi:MAG: VOC family protein [Pseudonocardia sp.]|nr:VOC family protein [Pseudonocardia sp.]